MEQVRGGPGMLDCPPRGVFCGQRGHPGPGMWAKCPCKVPSTGGCPLKSGPTTPPRPVDSHLPAGSAPKFIDLGCSRCHVSFHYLSLNALAPTCSGTRQVVCTRRCVVGGGGRQAPLWSPPALGAAHVIIPCPPWPLLKWPFGQVALPGLGAPRGHSPWRPADTLEFTWAPGPGPHCPLDHHPPCPGPAAKDGPKPQSTLGAPPQVSSLSQEALLRGRDEIV